MKKIVEVILYVGLILPAANGYASDANWTASVSKVIIRDSGIVAVVLAGTSNPNPPLASLNCEASIVYLGSKTESADPALVSAALTAYTADKSVRIGVNGSGTACTADYLTLE